VQLETAHIITEASSREAPISAMLFTTYFDSMMRDYTTNLHGKKNISNIHYYNAPPNKNMHGPTTSAKRNLAARKPHAPTMTRTYEKQPSSRATSTSMPMT